MTRYPPDAAAKLDKIADLLLHASAVTFCVNGKWERVNLPAWAKVEVAKALRSHALQYCWRTQQKSGELKVCMLPDNHYGNHRFQQST